MEKNNNKNSAIRLMLFVLLLIVVLAGMDAGRQDKAKDANNIETKVDNTKY